MVTWSPSSWREKPIKHVPGYPNLDHLKEVEKKIKSYPPLVFAGEARNLRNILAEASDGKAFLLQGGDCAESFLEHGPDTIMDTFKLFLQMSAVLTYAASVPVIKVGRIAGQFAKPRSSDTEVIDNKELMSYRGDIINGIEFNENSRTPDPERLLKSYRQSAATLNLIRSLSQGGYANLEHVHNWTLEFLNNSLVSEKYKDLANQISQTLGFMRACGITPESSHALRTTNLYTSHEALLLGYEEVMTRVDSTTGDWYATSAHMLWIGDRTRNPIEAHTEFCRGIKNPIGIKCGPSMTEDDLIKLLDTLNPENEKGRITLIARFGFDNVEKHLPSLIRCVKNHGHNVLWSCDPMHGNTVKASSGFKTRPFENIMMEVRNYMKVHKNEGTYPGGIHVEMTGNNVTECTGGAMSISDADLSSRYNTHCDPRLNANQALELAFLVAEEIRLAKTNI
ncbi:MAG: class II 3-deoxy-7-phosphoheptulonate synthase [Alphaproteobacteria bacterium]|jgi:3-deoxy-7-phosphoheptulonate synthase|tara:strand:- start:38488 stop:39843 length:1356 start_codon:yes stop_codon:yes gene_type:complete